MKENSSVSHLKDTVRSSFQKISSFADELPNKWKIGRRNFP